MVGLNRPSQETCGSGSRIAGQVGIGVRDQGALEVLGLALDPDLGGDRSAISTADAGHARARPAPAPRRGCGAWARAGDRLRGADRRPATPATSAASPAGAAGRAGRARGGTATGLRLVSPAGGRPSGGGAAPVRRVSSDRRASPESARSAMPARESSSGREVRRVAWRSSPPGSAAGSRERPAVAPASRSARSCARSWSSGPPARRRAQV